MNQFKKEPFPKLGQVTGNLTESNNKKNTKKGMIFPPIGHSAASSVEKSLARIEKQRKDGKSTIGRGGASIGDLASNPNDSPFLMIGGHLQIIKVPKYMNKITKKEVEGYIREGQMHTEDRMAKRIANPLVSPDERESLRLALLAKRMKLDKVDEKALKKFRNYAELDYVSWKTTGKPLDFSNLKPIKEISKNWAPPLTGKDISLLKEGIIEIGTETFAYPSGKRSRN